ncbi:MAG: NYN domain-containing protein [Desulfovibrio sp.]|nr:NYN domain-containing protein [Desulfovibrio sp.]
MARFSGFDEVLSALYVDFDNIYTRFLEQDAEAARSFGLTPYRWVRWLENHSLRILYGDGVRRRIIKRMCYLNPQRYQEFRNPFIRSAFQVVDCPPLTTRGKTSTDIHLVMDCMDDLSHSTHFDEFIILSGDADFTPLLIRLQEHARRTLLLSVGYSSPAYTAAASWRIREDWFIQQALKDERPDYREEKADADEPRGGVMMDAAPLPAPERMETARIISLGQRPHEENSEDDETVGPGNC